MRSAVLVFRFLLELCLLAALAYWGVRAGSGPLSSLLLGVGAPLVAAIAWGAFVAPRARFHLSPALLITVELVVFGAGALALWAVGLPVLAVCFGVAVLVQRVLLSVLPPGRLG